jgi:anti-sigma B factor antagonist
MPTIVQRDAGYTTVVPESEMTIYTAGEFKASLEGALAGCEHLEIDLAEVSELDSAGLQLLLAARRKARSSGKTFHLKGSSEAVRQVFALCNVTGDFGDPAETAK